MTAKSLLDLPGKFQRAALLKSRRINAAGFRAAISAGTTFSFPAYAQYEVAEIPFFNAPAGTAALGGGVRLGQDLYIATDNEDQRQYDLVPLYLYNGKYLFFRGTAGGLHLFKTDSVDSLSPRGRTISSFSTPPTMSPWSRLQMPPNIFFSS